MERGRIHSVVSENWGHGTVYTYDPLAESKLEMEQSVVLHHAISSISEEVPELLIPEPVTLVPIEGLPFLISSLYATILEDIMAQMWTLERCNNELSISKTLSDMDHLKAIKYEVWNPNEVINELEGINLHNLSCVTYKIKKLDSDRKYLNNVIVSIYLDLAQKFTFHPLLRFIKEIEDRNHYRHELEEEENRNKILRRDLLKQVRQQRNHIKSILYDTDVIIDKLRTNVEDSVLFTEVRGRYIDNWQRARSEQHNQSIFDIENVPDSSIEYHKQRSDQELRIHSEVELLVNISINETLARIEEWMDKYDKDIEKIDLKIQIKKNDYQNMRDKRTELEETLALHEEQMKAWVSFKNAREKERAYREKMTTSAIIVQAWWRGLLVRLELGPFRPKKGRKKKK